jgi:DNA mismatch endonuclease, patch repair protein
MDTVTPEERSRIMAKVKGSGNKSTEQRLIFLFKEWGIKGWRRRYPLFGKPDFVFPKARLAVFVDGCFWHGCRDHCRLPSNNQDYWMSKIQRNVERDRRVSRELAEKNWRVIRVWEHELKKGRHVKKINEIKQAVDGGVVSGGL